MGLHGKKIYQSRLDLLLRIVCGEKTTVISCIGQITVLMIAILIQK